MIGRYRRKRRRRKGRSGVGRWTLSRKCALSPLYSITSLEGRRSLYTGILFLAVFLRSVRTTTCRFQPCVLYVYILEQDSHKYPTWGHFAISRNANNNCQCRHSLFLLQYAQSHTVIPVTRPMLSLLPIFSSSTSLSFSPSLFSLAA